MGKKLLTQITKCSLSIPSIVFFTLVFGVEISNCTISSNHHHCILFFPFSLPLQGDRLEFRICKYSRPLMSIDYLKQIHIHFNAVSGSHFYGKQINCLSKKADICYAILDILFNKYDIYFNLFNIYYKEEILYSKYDIHLIILNIQNVNIRYSQC